MAKMSNKHTADFKKDPLTDRAAMVDSMKGFKGSKYPESGFKSNKPKTAIDEFYTPFKGKVAK